MKNLIAQISDFDDNISSEDKKWLKKELKNLKKIKKVKKMKD